jgi:glucose-6-phosphate dehydrogenase assembly protein OpcA
MQTSTLHPLLDAPRRVDVRAIERELGELWRIAAQASEAEHLVLTRARTMTLVAYAAHPESGAALGEVIARTSQRHPARAILLVNDPAQSGLEALVGASCQVLGRNHKQICCEQITIRAEPQAQDRLLSIVRHLVLPDMPVVLYWPIPLAPDGLFQDLLDVADRVIIDTAAFPDGPAGLLTAPALAATATGAVALSDLNWGRLTAWRGLTAHFFDPPHTDYLDRIERVRVAHAASSRAQALLYLGWLAGRLHWRVDRPFSRGEGPWRALLAAQGDRQITASLHPQSRSSLPAGALLSAMIVAEESEATFSIVLKEDAGGVIAVAEAGKGPAIRRALPLEAADEGSLLSAELDVLGRDRVYEESLRAVAALLGPA